MYLVYRAVSPSGKIYIGMTSQTLSQRRATHHRHAASRCRTIFHKALIHYDFNFQWSIVADGLELHAARQREADEIRRAKSFDRSRGYNQTTGGGGLPGYKHSDMNLLRMRLKKLSRSGRTQDLAVVAFVEVCLKHGRLPRKKDIPRTTPPDVLFYLINTLRHKRGITPLRKPRMWLHELMPYVSYPLCDYHQLSDIVQDLSTRAIALQSYRSASEI